MHTAAADAFENDPAAQSKHVLLLSGAYWPAIHVSQPVAADWLLNVPPEQARQRDAPELLVYEPGVQARHAEEPADA